MEHKENQNLHALTQLTDTGFVEKFTKFVVSVSVFSFLFSHSYPSLSFLHSFNFYFLTFPYQLVTHTVNKNCIFLLCNGLVVFLAKYSGLIWFLSPSNRPDHHETFKSIIDVNSSLESSVPEMSKEMMSLDKETAEQSIYVVEQQGSDQNERLIKDHEQERASASMVSDTIEGEQEPGRSSILSNEEEEEEETVIYVEEDEEEDYKWSKGGFELVGQRVEIEEEEEEEEEEEGIGMLSTEELNKKFDEFIRKMKEEIRIEAQTQLIMV